MESVQLEGLVAIILSLGIPIVAIVSGVVSSVKKKKLETELRRVIVENHTDLDVARALIEEQEKKPSKFGSLRGACVLIGLGIGALVNYLLNVSTMAGPEGIYFWVVLAFGVGLGLLASFIVEQKLKKQEPTPEEQ